MEIQFQHHHVLTFCDQNQENFSHILFKFFKRDERNRRKVVSDLEVAEFDYEEDYPKCLVCLRIIDDGPVYFCEMCDGIWVHKSCAYLPREIRPHLQHDHPLTLLGYNAGLYCEGCGLMISGPTYGCLECNVYLHKSCAELPQRIQHPYHPFHNLFLENSEGCCRACRNHAKSPRYVYGKPAKSLRYRCHWCPSFLLDTECAINNLGVTSALKNKEYHQHDLYYFVGQDSDRSYDLKFECHSCNNTEASFFNWTEASFFNWTEASFTEKWDGAFYICLECDSYFHMGCVGILKEVKHDSHLHPLTLMDPLTEDKIDESKDQYYCYTCEEKRNPRYHAYSCQQCAKTGHIFTAHIECVLSSELNEIEHNRMIKEDDEEDSHEKFADLCKLSCSPRCMKQLLIEDKLNDHVLNYFEDIIDFSCYLCQELVKSSRYECSFCQIHLHKECAKLPSKIKHNLHEHPLSMAGGEFLKTYICNGCHVYHANDMCYYCEECGFFLDKMCAQMIPSIGNHYLKLNDNGSKVGFSHFSHNHKLRFALIPEKLEVHCLACRLLIAGPTYCCYACDFFLHKSCFDELKPQYIQHPFHIQHPLHYTIGEATCKACKGRSNHGYNCANCHFRLDTKCVKYLTSSLQHKCHKHNLFYFVDEDIHDDVSCHFYCNECSKVCDASFYRCLECGFNLHIDCISIPKNVKSVCHVHPLALMDTIDEKEVRDEYYCDACESLRNPKHAAYYCKKCYYTAHIGCVLDEEDGELEIL